MIPRCVLIILFLIVLFLFFMCYLISKVYVCAGKNELNDPIYEKLVELNLTKDEANELSKNIIKILSEYSDNTFIISSKLDKIIRDLDKESLKKIQKDKEYIRVLLDIKEGIEGIRIIEEDETVCDLYECPRCGSKKHTYKEVQQRAIDEPTNVKCECKVCGMKWDQD